MDNRNLSRYGSHYIAKSLAVSLLSVFIPVYLLANGFSLIQVGFFLLFQESINLTFTILLSRKVHTMSLRAVIATAVVAQMVLVITVYEFLSVQWSFLILIAGIRGFHDSLYWGSYNITLLRLSGKRTGDFLGKWHSAITLATVGTTLIAGYILDHYSPGWLLFFTLILYVVSIIPLRKLIFPPLPGNEVLPLRKSLSSPVNRYMFLVSHMNEFGIKLLDSFLPLYIFIVFKNFVSLGIAGLFAALGQALYSYLTGRGSDNQHRRPFLLFGNILGFAIVFSSLAFVKDPKFIFIASSLLGFFWLASYITAEAGINKRHITEYPYGKKMLERFGENMAGMLVGIVIMLTPFLSINIALAVAPLYMIFIASIIYWRYKALI